MEANATTPLFKEPTNMEVVEEIDIDIDLVMLMSMVVENYFQHTPPTTCTKPSTIGQNMHT
jgi:hypothetical protein